MLCLGTHSNVMLRFMVQALLSLYTVTKTTQNEALLWKITILGKDKILVGAGTFYTSPILVIYILYAGRVFRPQGSTFCRADAGRFRKSLKIKMTGKTAGDSLQRLHDKEEHHIKVQS